MSITFMIFNLSYPKIGTGYTPAPVTLFQCQTCQAVSLCYGLTARCRRHPDRLFVLIGDTADADSIFIQCRRSVKAADYLDSKDRIVLVGFRMDGKEVSVAFVRAVSLCPSRDSFQGSSDGIVTDDNAFLQVVNMFAEKIFG